MQQLDPSSTLYNETEILEVKGRLEVEKVEEIFGSLLARHQSLRTSFELVEGEVNQRINGGGSFRVALLEEESKVEDFIRPFDLSVSPLLRVGIQPQGLNGYKMIIDSHHIVMDGVSRLLLLEEFHLLYRGEKLEGLRLDYKDYSEWQQGIAYQQQVSREKAFWKEEFGGWIPSVDLPLDYSRGKERSYEGDYLRMELGLEQSLGLKRLAGSEGTTVFTVLLSLMSILLSRLTNSEEVVIGVPVGGRQEGGLEKIIGMFVNTLALRQQVAGSKEYRGFLEDVKRRSLRCFENQMYPFEELVNELKLERLASRHPLFDVMLVYQHYEERFHKVEGLEIRPENLNHSTSRFDLTVLAVEDTGGITLRFIYARELFKETTIKRFMGYVSNLVREILKDPRVLVKDMEMLSPEEKHQLLVEFNDTSMVYSKEKTVIDLFERQVEQNPDNIALVHGKERITYQQLNNLSNKIAAQIQSRMAGEKSRICLLFNSSIEMVASMLAVLKCGCTYVPLSPDNSPARNEYIFLDCSAKLLLAAHRFANDRSLISFVEETKILTVAESNYSQQNDSINLNYSAPGDPMYVIYTSGTTGNPKGVEVKNTGLVNMLHFYGKLFQVKECTKMSQIANVGFDASAFEIWPSLIYGGCLYIAFEQIRHDPELMKQWLIQNAIEVVFLPTIIAEHLLKDERDINRSSVKIMNVAGDRLKYIPSCELSFKLYNLYGPTEDSIWTTWIELKQSSAGQRYSIGKPISNKKILILNKDRKLQPIGVPGELHIAGDGLASGYVNNEKLTAEKFIQNPFDPNEQIYRTGDLGSWLADGNIEYLGRIDHQVKIRSLQRKTSL